MKYFMQETKHNPPESYGDCIRTCIACLLDREPLTVPNFFDPRQCEELPGQYADPWAVMEQWLFDERLTSVKIHVGGDLASLQRYMAAMNDGVLYILMGDGHAVIGCGDTIIHDPSWLKLGVKEPSHMLFLLPASMKYTGPEDICPKCKTPMVDQRGGYVCTDCGYLAP